MIHDQIIAILRCPVTRQPLRRATAAEKARWGLPAEEDALVSEDGTRYYRSVNEMPILLPSAEVVASG